jgi:4'-phosphopantetheinyl transferase
VDIEYMSEISEIESIAERFFSRKENDSMRSLPEEQKIESFIKGWTCKEAYIKALGAGMSHALDKFEVSMAPGVPAKLLRVEGDSREASRWSMHYFQLAPDYACAFAAKSIQFEIKFWRWEVLECA